MTPVNIKNPAKGGRRSICYGLMVGVGRGVPFGFRGSSGGGVGDSVGSTVGDGTGGIVGTTVGITVGITVGDTVGETVGSAVGEGTGVIVGAVSNVVIVGGVYLYVRWVAATIKPEIRKIHAATEIMILSNIISSFVIKIWCLRSKRILNVLKGDHRPAIYNPRNFSTATPV